MLWRKEPEWTLEGNKMDGHCFCPGGEEAMILVR